MLGWLSETLWGLLYVLKPAIAAALSAPVLIFGAFAFSNALLACNNIPRSVPELSRLLMMSSTAVNAAWLTMESAVGILLGVAANSHAPLAPIAAALAATVAVVGATVTLREASAAYSLTLLWGFWGVHRHNSDGELVDKVAVSCGLLFAVLSVGLVAKNAAMVTRGQQPSVPGGSGAQGVEAAAGEPLLQP